MATAIRDVKNITGGSAAPVFSVDPILGDSIIVVSGRQGTAASAPIDSAGNTYIQIGTTRTETSWSLSLIVWAALNITHTTTPGAFSVTTNSGSFSASIVWLISGNLTYNNDQTYIDSSVTAGGNMQSPNSATPSASSIFFGFVAFAPSASTLTDNAGWNVVGSNGFTSGMLANTKTGTFSSSCPIASQYRITTSSAQASWASSAGDSYGAMVFSFLTSGGGGGSSASQGLIVLM